MGSSACTERVTSADGVADSTRMRHAHDNRRTAHPRPAGSHPHRVDRHRRDGRQHVQPPPRRGVRRHGDQPHPGQGRGDPRPRRRVGRDARGRRHEMRHRLLHGRLPVGSGGGAARRPRRRREPRPGRCGRRHDLESPIARRRDRGRGGCTRHRRARRAGLRRRRRRGPARCRSWSAATPPRSTPCGPAST